MENLGGWDSSDIRGGQCGLRDDCYAGGITESIVRVKRKKGESLVEWVLSLQHNSRPGTNR